MTSVFLVLMVKSKLSQALEKRFTHCCISTSLLLLSAQSSAKRSSLSVATFTYVCFESSEVEHSSICSVLQLDAIVIILGSVVKHGSEYHAEEGSSENTALFHTGNKKFAGGQ